MFCHFFGYRVIKLFNFNEAVVVDSGLDYGLKIGSRYLLIIKGGCRCQVNTSFKISTSGQCYKTFYVI
jgi:hypothetical protein